MSQGWPPMMRRGHETTGFRIPSPARATLAAGGNDAPARWLGAAEAIVVQGTRIEGGLLYVGGAFENSFASNCLIDPTLPVARHPDVSGSHMPYWPSYGLIHPESRLAYLEWLGDGRKAPCPYVGYVFLYYYGLERRLFVDRSSADAPAIITEIERLMQVAAEHRSFIKYASKGVEAARAVFNVPRAGSTSGSMVEIKTQAGRNAARTNFWSHEDILQLLRSGAFGGAYAGLDEEVLARFLNLLRSSYPAGMDVAPSVPKLALEVGLSAVKQTVFIGTDALDALADRHLVSRIGSIVASLRPSAAIHHVPSLPSSGVWPVGRQRSVDPARQGRDDQRRPQTRQISAEALRREEWVARLPARVESGAEDGLSPLPLDEVLEIFGVGPGTVKKSSYIGCLRHLDAAGVSVEPDPRFGGALPASGAVLLAFSGKDGGRSPDLARMASLRAGIEIGLGVACRRDRASEAALSCIRSWVSSRADVPQDERLRGLAYVQLTSGDAQGGFRRPMAAAVRESDRPDVARLSASVSAADGQPDRDTVKLIEKIYEALGLTKDQAYSDIHVVSAGGRLGERSLELRFDMDRLKRIEADTVEASRLLGEVFEAGDETAADEHLGSDDVAAVVADEAGRSHVVAQDDIPGLDLAHASFVRVLSQFVSLPLAQVEDLARNAGLMPSGAIETVNDWAWGRFGAPLLEDGDPVVVEGSLIAEWVLPRS